MYKRALSAAMIAVTFSMFTPLAHARQCADVTMRNSVTVDGQELVLNGMGVREATVFNVNVYVAGLYVAERSNDATAILDADTPKQLIMHMVRTVSRDDMNDAFRNSLDRMEGDFSRQVGQIRGWLPEEISDGTRIVITFHADHVDFRIRGGQGGRLEGAEFSRAFLSIWIGSRPPNRGLKRGLLGGRCSG